MKVNRAPKSWDFIIKPICLFTTLGQSSSRSLNRYFLLGTIVDLPNRFSSRGDRLLDTSKTHAYVWQNFNHENDL